jgi:CubicO group peptidase (beta-lactamase class C family)
MGARLRGRRLGRVFSWPALLVLSAAVGAHSAAAQQIRATRPAPPSFAATSETRLQAVVDGLVSTVFLGRGLTGASQAFFVPGATLTVAPPRGPIRTYVAGRSNLAGYAPMRPRLVQPIGSGTKPMTAVLVLRLVEGGRIRVDQRLPAVAVAHRRDGGRLAEIVRAFPSRLRRITLRQLLNMTSGLADYDDSPAFVRDFARRPRADRSLARLARYGLARRPLFAPGARGRTFYSNTNYVLLAMVVEAVTGRPYGRELGRLFRRLGMRASAYGGPPRGRPRVRGYMHQLLAGPHVPAIIRGYARAFARAPTVRARVAPRAVADVSSDPRAEGPTVPVLPAGPAEQRRYGRATTVAWRDVTRAYSVEGVGAAAGGVVSNTADLARFWRALFRGRLLRPRTLRLLRQSVPAQPNARGVRNFFALGPQRQDVAAGVLWPGSPRLRIWMHLGDIWGYTSASYYVEGPPAVDELVVTNTTNLLPSPVGDLGVLARTLRALAR